MVAPGRASLRATPGVIQTTPSHTFRLRRASTASISVSLELAAYWATLFHLPRATSGLESVT